MTPAGRDRMRAQLDHLKRVERPNISAAIEEARGHGDLKENAEYHSAKEKQGFIEAKIRELDAKLSLAQVVDPTKLSGSRVSFGATVTLVDTDTEEELKYSIVGEDEADHRAGLLSYQAPVARALMGREEGDTVEVKAANPPRTFEIEKVEFVEIKLPGFEA